METPKKKLTWISLSFEKLWFEKDLLQRLEKEWRLPNRPLRKISDFVVEQMPYYNSFSITPERAKLIENIFPIIDEEYLKFKNDENTYLEKNWKDQDLIYLDLIYLLNFLRRVLGENISFGENENVRDEDRAYPGFAGIEIPKSLELFVHWLARHLNRIPHLTYEDLILNNPLDSDPRLFYSNEIANSEYLFYLWHNLIEKKFDEIIFDVKTIIDNPTAEIDINKIKKNRKETIKLLWKFYQLNKKDFNIFRTFYFWNELLWYRWASWAFSSSIPVLDLLIGLDTLEKANKWYLDSNLMHYPSKWQLDVQLARKLYMEWRTILSLWLSNRSEDLISLYKEIGAGILRFRKSHLSLVKKHLPQVFNWSEDWTWWFNVDDFLNANIEYTKKLVDWWNHESTNR